MSRTMSTGAVARMLGVSRWTVRRLAVRHRRLAATRPGHHLRITRESVQALLALGAGKAAPFAPQSATQLGLWDCKHG